MHLHKAYMYIDFQQKNKFVDPSEPCTQIYLHNIANCINLQLAIVILNLCIIVKRTYISIFSKIGLVDRSKPCIQIYLEKIAICIDLQLPIVILKKKIFRLASSQNVHVYQFSAKSG